jgi:predicted DNA-binding ribbon-helix-helix protein
MDHFGESAMIYKGDFGGPMTSTILKRSIVIGGRKTSVSLEDPFWTGLKQIAEARQMFLSELVTKIDGGREQSNLSSAIRLFVLHHFRNKNERMDVAKAHLSTAGAERAPASQP